MAKCSRLCSWSDASPSPPHPRTLHPTLFPAATALVAHKVTVDTTIGAEVVRDLAANTTTFAAGEQGLLDPGWLAGLVLDRRWTGDAALVEAVGECITCTASLLPDPPISPVATPLHRRPVQAAGGRRTD